MLESSDENAPEYAACKQTMENHYVILSMKISCLLITIHAFKMEEMSYSCATTFACEKKKEIT